MRPPSILIKFTFNELDNCIHAKEFELRKANVPDREIIYILGNKKWFGRVDRSKFIKSAVNSSFGTSIQVIDGRNHKQFYDLFFSTDNNDEYIYEFKNHCIMHPANNIEQSVHFKTIVDKKRRSTVKRSTV